MNQYTLKLAWFPLLALALFLLAGQPNCARAAGNVGVNNEDFASMNFDDGPTTKTAAREGAPTLGGMAARLLVALGIVFTVMTGALWAARRWLPRSVRNQLRGGGIDLLATRALGQRRSLIIVRARDKTLLLGITPGSIQCLAELDQDEAWSEAADAVGLPEGAFEPRPGRPGQE